jgi:hypothetical protein
MATELESKACVTVNETLVVECAVILIKSLGRSIAAPIDSTSSALSFSTQPVGSKLVVGAPVGDVLG